LKRTISFKVSEEAYNAIHGLKNSRGYTLKRFILLSIVKWIKAHKKLNPPLSHYYDRKLRIIQRELQEMDDRP